MDDKTKKGRQTLVKQVIQLLKTKQFPHDAADVCSYGRPLSDLEQGMRCYYGTRELMKDAIRQAMKSGEKERKIFEVKEPGKPMRKMTKSASMIHLHEQIKKHIAEEFFRALDNSDSEKILEIARGVWFFRNKRPGNFVPADPERMKLLHFKMTLAPWEKVTIRTIAQHLAGTDDIPTPADGFSALRRKCRQLGIPLAESRKRSKK